MALGAIGAEFSWEAGCDASGPADAGSDKIPAAVKLAAESDVSILVLGDIGNTCGEWADRDSLDLPGGQLMLLSAVANASKKTILILVHGRPSTFGAGNVGLSQVDGLLAAWRPGEEAGTALVNLLTGKTNPSAKLSQSWPRTVGHVLSGSSPWLQRVRGKWLANKRGSQDPDGRRYDAYVSSLYDPTPLFYFGFGLSYSKYKYSNLELRWAVPPERLAPMRDQDRVAVLNVSVTVKNIGGIAGSEIVQAYLTDPVGLPFVPFWKRLVGFERITLGAGEQRVCVVQIEWQDLAMHDIQMVLRVFGGTYKISVGGASNQDSLSHNFVLP
eukprot:TRINITY_DN2933_c0_g1_i5.p1 TRINITY_DN2933_c0_g1~~TRINITY_DN2933_c0_g1_i5.p1  ORF type:complete len:328 (+),score=57.01 TRINITY_DN2933_c0_g1_i5:299-1282(+)